MRIRPATPADVPALHALVERAYRGDAARAGWTHEADLLGGQRTDAAALHDTLGQPRSCILVAEDAGRLVATVRLDDLGHGLVHLGMLAVEPARQAGGLGRAILAAGEAHAAAAFGATRIEMTVIAQRPELIAWYGRRGWHPTGETRPFPHDDRRFGEPRRPDLVFVVLEKPLASEAVARSRRLVERRVECRVDPTQADGDLGSEVEIGAPPLG